MDPCRLMTSRNCIRSTGPAAPLPTASFLNGCSSVWRTHSQLTTRVTNIIVKALFFFLKTEGKKKRSIHLSLHLPFLYFPRSSVTLLLYVYFNFVECVSSLAYGKTTRDCVCVCVCVLDVVPSLSLSLSLYSPKENKSGTQGRQLTRGSAAILRCGAEHFSGFIPVMQGACPSNTCLTGPHVPLWLDTGHFCSYGNSHCSLMTAGYL
jgi:hypothetical protein